MKLFDDGEHRVEVFIFNTTIKFTDLKTGLSIRKDKTQKDMILGMWEDNIKPYIKILSKEQAESLNWKWWKMRCISELG